MKTLALLVVTLGMLAVLAASTMAEDKLVVKVAVDPATVSPGNAVRVIARTAPDAVCTATVKFRAVTWTGRGAKANRDGEIVWLPPMDQRAPGVFPVTVHCALGDQKAEGTASLTIR